MKRNASAGLNNYYGVGLQLFSEDDIQQIHLGTLEVLERTGLGFGSDEALDYFAKGGAKVDFDKKTVKIPPYMVEEALKSAPPSVFLAGKDPQYDIVMQDGRVYCCPFGAGIFVEDPYTGNIRESLKKDVIACAKIIDYLDEYDFCFNTVVSRDVPGEVLPIHNFSAHFMNTKKPCLAGPFHTRMAEYQIEMGIAQAGSLQALQERPLMMLGGCTISPLTIPDAPAETIIAAAKHRLPMMCLSMAMTGGMAPVTLAGALVVMNAEILGAIVLSQLVNKGTPFVYGSSTGILDMRYNATAMVGCPELALVSAAVAALARHYGLPSLVAGG